MKLFADTGNLKELKELKEMGLISGVTTNPTIASKEGQDLITLLKNITELLPDIPVFGQVVATKTDEIVKEARRIAAVAQNIVVKIPATIEGVKAIKILTDENIRTCATTILTAAEAFLCAAAGAAYVAPYTGQNDIIGFKGVDTLKQICDTIHSAGLKSEVLVASVEKAQEVIDFILAGSDVITMPYHVFIDAFECPMPLTNYYINSFHKDWSDAGCFIK